MTYPLVGLAFFAVTAGWLNIPGIYTGFTDFVGTRLYPMGDHHPESIDWPFVLIVTPLVLIGIVVGWLIFGPDRDTQAARDRFRIPGLYPLLRNGYYIDDFYMDGIVRPTMGPLARGVLWFDLYVIDGVANGVAGLTSHLASDTVTFDDNAVDGVYNVSAAATGVTGSFMRRFFSGRIQQYAALAFAGVVVIAALVLMF
jgi:NADH-quinone oxidoreductase subunit L